MDLYYKVIGEGKPLLILHGLFGTSDNWMTIAKQLTEQFKVYLIDQRNHGRSPHSADFSYELMAQDLKEFIERHISETPHILGHSMGGKTAMNLAVKNPSLLDRLIIVDIAPKTYPVHHDKIIEGLKSLDFTRISSRKEADKQLSTYIPQFDVRQFLLKNLKRNKDNTFGWKMNLDAISNNIESIGEGLGENDHFDHKTLFIRGSKSNYILDEDKDLLNKHFPENRLVTVKNAGHWVHAEAPDVLLETIKRFLKSKSRR